MFSFCFFGVVKDNKKIDVGAERDLFWLFITEVEKVFIAICNSVNKYIQGKHSSFLDVSSFQAYLSCASSMTIHHMTASCVWSTIEFQWLKELLY